MASTATDISLQARLNERFERDSDRHALAFYNAAGEYSWLSYGDVFQRAEHLASGMTEYGLGPGDVCVLVLNSDEFSAHAILATLLLGGIPLLVAPPVIQGANSSLRDIVHGVISRTQARLAIFDNSMLDMQEELVAGNPGTTVLFGQDALSAAAGKPIQRAQPVSSDIVGMQLTSGTTGFPKICVWKQHSMLAALDGMADAMHARRDDIYLNWTPLYHDMGLVNNFLLCLSRGIPLVMLKPHDFVKDPAIWLRAMADTGATITWAPNFGFALAAQRVRDEQIEGVRLDHVKGFWNAAERIHQETLVAFRERFEQFGLAPQALKTNFGCAENIGGATFSDPQGAYVVEYVDPHKLYEEGIAEPCKTQDATEVVPIVGVGRAHPGMTIQILSEEGDPLPDGRVGKVALATPSRMEGYLEDPEESKRVLVGPLLLTGDLGYLRNGELFWVGRTQERITVRGRKIDPSDFERILLNVAGLRPGCFTAFGIDDPASGSQRVVLVSEVKPDCGRSTKEITEEIREKTFTTMGLSISDVVLVEPGTLIKTSSGKRRHRHFRELYLKDQLKSYTKAETV
jgi:acyl-CoA synthetase (AMP-forming)/AMP-acid ligase II